ncbi:MAG: ABC-2 transporter permease, partial [Anaerovoracaceae bacterium]
MFDKSVVLNMKLASNEFGFGLGITILGFLFMMIGGVMSFAALVCFLATLVFFVMGFVKLFYKSLFSNEAYLYMSLPISNLQVVLSKVFVGTLWLSLWVGLLLGSVLLFLAQNGSFLEALIGSLLIEGVPAEKIGALMVV